jgi:hypothetical protein
MTQCVRLENWSVEGRISPYQAPELMVSYLCGNVYNHPVDRHFDGKRVSTSRLLVLDTKNRRAITNSREYKLGEPAKEWLEYLKKNEYNLGDYDFQKTENLASN